MKFAKTLFALTLAGATAAILSLPVQAQTTIDQNKVTSKGIGGSDAAGFPITISQPGSYKLTGNIVVPAGSVGIEITAPGVSLDLNGYTISGPVTCAAYGACSMPQTVAHGVSISAAHATLRNGVITGFQGHGIYVVGPVVLEDLVVSQNSGGGVVGMSTPQSNSLINRVRASMNRTNGFYMFATTFHDCMAASNGWTGFTVSTSSLFDSTASDNGSTGIATGSRVLLRGNRTYSNGAGNIAGSYSSGGGNLDDTAPF